MALDDKTGKNTKEEAEMSAEEQIGFHKGSLNTLIAERNELIKLVQITESLIQAHAKELEKLGVNLNKGNKDNNSNKRPANTP